MFTIRPISYEERLAVLEVYRQCEDFLSLGPQPRASLEMVDADLALSRQAGGVFCGIYLPGPSGEPEMVGVVDYVPGGYGGVSEHADLSLLMIAAPYRSAGLGRAVAEWVEAQVRANPAVTAILSGVQVNNPGAIRFWTRMGYRITSGPELQADQTTTFQLWKDL